MTIYNNEDNANTMTDPSIMRLCVATLNNRHPIIIENKNHNGHEYVPSPYRMTC